MSLGLGLLYMGRTEQAEDVLETIDAIEHPISKTLKVLVNICAFAGTGMYYKSKHYYKCTAKPKDQLEEEKNWNNLRRNNNNNKDTKSNGEGGEEEDVEMEDAESRMRLLRTPLQVLLQLLPPRKGDSSSVLLLLLLQVTKRHKKAAMTKKTKKK